MSQQTLDDTASDEATINTDKLESQTSTAMTTTEDPRHKKQSYTISPRIVSDAILGLSDGLTVPFALTAGLSALGTSRLVVLGGLAELMAGAISMGLGGYVGAKSEAESYAATSRTCDALIKSSPAEAARIVYTHFEQYGLPSHSAEGMTETLTADPTALKRFLLEHHFAATALPDNRPYVSALTLGVSYMLGGILPLLPYFFIGEVSHALWVSVGLMAVVLLGFGWVKTGVVRGWRGRGNVLAAVKGSVQMLVVGAVAAGAAVGLVRAVNAGGAGVVK